MLKLRRITMQEPEFQVLADTEMFAQRILGNYGLMQMRISAETLIQAMLVPYEQREIESQSPSVLVQNIQIRQQACLDVVNQLTNRLQAVERGKQNYQDAVFIQAVLNKLGIHNQIEFLRLITETSGISAQKRELVRLCGGTRQIFTTLKKELEVKKPRLWRRRRSGGRERTEKGRYYLHQSVYERMKLWESYNSLQELRKLPGEHLKEPGTDFAERMENLEFADSLFVSQLNENVFGIRETEGYPTFNPYERWNPNMEPLSREQLFGTLASAILLNLVKETSIYTAGFHGRMSGTNRLFWLNLKEAVSRSSQMTAAQFLYYHRSLRQADMENQKELLSVISDGFAREVRILYSIRDMAGGREQEDDTKELKKTQRIIAQLLSERQETFQEELLDQTGRMLHAVTQIEEDIRRYVYDTEVYHMTERHWDSVEEAELIHIRREGEAGERTAAETPSVQERQMMRQDVSLKDMNYRDTKNIRLNLAEKSKKEVSRLVKDNIQEQMNLLTDKVYSRLEHRLQNEKKRRGM